MNTWIRCVCSFIGCYSMLNVIGCIISVESDNDGDEYYDDHYNNYDNYDDDDDDRSQKNGCYENTSFGCSHISWSDVENIIDTVYLLRDTYNGYTKDEALSLARRIYDNGVYPKAYLNIVAVQELANNRHRAYLIATGANGYPAVGLNAMDFDIELSNGEIFSPLNVRHIADLSGDEIQANIAVVIDDSGSVQDCDANFVAEGLSHLFKTLPPMYSAELIKFESEVYIARDWTTNGHALANSMLTYCTNRSSTALWDGLYKGINDLPDEGDINAVVVFTDGLNNDSLHTFNQVVSAAEAKGVPVLVAALGLADIFAMFDLAIGTGGGFVYIPTGEEILDAFEILTSFITEAYVIEWETSTDFDTVKIQARLEDNNSIADTFHTN